MEDTKAPLLSKENETDAIRNKKNLDKTYACFSIVFDVFFLPEFKLSLEEYALLQKTYYKELKNLDIYRPTGHVILGWVKHMMAILKETQLRRKFNT